MLLLNTNRNPFPITLSAHTIKISCLTRLKAISFYSDRTSMPIYLIVTYLPLYFLKKIHFIRFKHSKCQEDLCLGKRPDMISCVLSSIWLYKIYLEKKLFIMGKRALLFLAMWHMSCSWEHHWPGRSYRKPQRMLPPSSRNVFCRHN